MFFVIFDFLVKSRDSGRISSITPRRDGSIRAIRRPPSQFRREIWKSENLKSESICHQQMHFLHKSRPEASTLPCRGSFCHPKMHFLYKSRPEASTLPCRGSFRHPKTHFLYKSRSEASTLPCRGSFCHPKMHFLYKDGRGAAGDRPESEKYGFAYTKPYFGTRQRIQLIQLIQLIQRIQRSGLQLGPHLPHAPGARMTVVN